MNKNIKTSMILTTSTIALLAIMFAPNQVFAHDTPWYGGAILPSGYAGYWFHCTSLNPLSVDGDTTNNCSEVQGSVEDAMENYNDLSGNDLDLETTGSFTDKWVYATNLAPWGPSAEATYPNVDDGYVRFNNLRSFGTDGGCQTTLGIVHAYNLEWLSNHELGHSVGLDHHNGHTSVMVDSCDSLWSAIQTDDEDTLDTKYS